jgi:hypothetical protein
MATARQQIAAKPPRTELRVGDDEDMRPIVDLPHTDTDGWWAQARTAFGTASAPFVEAEIRRLLKALRARNSTLPLETEVNAAIAVIEGLQPRNEIEAMLAVQAALVHVTAVAMLTRQGQLSPFSDPQIITATSSAAAKLLRAFAGHVEVLNRGRRPTVQTVRVERVNIEPGGQAVVGVIGAPGESRNREDQPHGTAN